MAQTNFEAVRAFHAKMGVPEHTVPTVMDMETMKFRLKFMQEELDEFKEALNAHLVLKNLSRSDIHYSESVQLLAISNMADALIDLVYVAMGTAAMMGLPWQTLFDEVQRANMTKVLAKSAEQSAAETGRGHKFDVVKPAGWTQPNIAGIIADYGFMPATKDAAP